jgi:hypothetical protein
MIITDLVWGLRGLRGLQGEGYQKEFHGSVLNG